MVVDLVPGTKITRVERPLGINPVGAPLGALFVGTGSRFKRVTDEAVVKGLVEDEAFSIATLTLPGTQITGSATATNTGTLTNRAVRDADLVTVTRTMSGNTQVLNYGRNEWGFLPAYVTPATAIIGDLAITATVGSSFSLDIDGMSMTIIMIDGGTAGVAIDGHNVTVTITATTTANSLTLAERVAAVNAAVNAYAIDQGNEIDYSACAFAGTNGLTIFSQIEGPDSEVVVYAGILNDVVSSFFGSALSASTRIQLSTIGAGTGATFVVDYAAAVDTVDALANEPSTLVSVGSTPGRSDYLSGIDFTLSGDDLTWSSTAATLTSSVASTRLNRTIASTAYAITLTTTLTITVAAGHGLVAGDYITFNTTAVGAVGELPIIFPLTSVTATTLVYVTTGLSNSSATEVGSVVFHAIRSELTVAGTVTTADWTIASNVQTITTAAAHGLVVGDLITFQAATNTGDLIVPTRIATVPSTTTLTVANVGANIATVTNADTITHYTRSGLNESFGWTIDRHPMTWVDLISPASSPVGFSGGLTQADIVTSLNAFAVRDFGPRYASTAAVVTVGGLSVIRLSSYLTGALGQITLAANDTATGAIGTATVQEAAIEALFGIEAAALPAEADAATAEAPVQGFTYYVTYDYVRPTSEYVTRYSFTDINEARAQAGLPSANVGGYNPLALALEIADQIGVPEFNFIQINDVTSPGSPTIAEIQDALSEAELEAGNTEIVLVGAAGARSDAWSEVLAHVEAQSGSDENHPRRGYCGAASSTVIGTVNQEQSLLWAPSRVFSVSATSQARGRTFFCVGPKRSGSAIQYDTRLEDGSSATLDLDHTYVAVAAAAWRASRASAADSMTNETLAGVFRVPTKAQSWNSRELRRLIAGSCLVLASNGGQLYFVEGLTTERAGAAAASFEIDTGTVQDDVLRVKSKSAMDRSLIGIEPISIPTFLFDCKILLKSIIESVISAKEAGEYLNPDGSVRELDIDRDISFKSVRNDPRRYRFTYSANRRFAVGIIEGSYTPDINLFASLASSGV